MLSTGVEEGVRITLLQQAPSSIWQRQRAISAARPPARRGGPGLQAPPATEAGLGSPPAHPRGGPYRPSPVLGPLPEIVGPGANDSFAEPPPSVKDTAPLQKRAPISPYRPLGYSKKLCNLLPSHQQIVFHHDFSSSPIHLFTDLPELFWPKADVVDTCRPTFYGFSAIFFVSCDTLKKLSAFVCVSASGISGWTRFKPDTLETSILLMPEPRSL